MNSSTIEPSTERERTAEGIEPAAALLQLAARTFIEAGFRPVTKEPWPTSSDAAGRFTSIPLASPDGSQITLAAVTMFNNLMLHVLCGDGTRHSMQLDTRAWRPDGSRDAAFSYRMQQSLVLPVSPFMVAPFADLTGLPADAKESLLSYLPATSLGQLACTSSPYRAAVTGADSVWLALTVRDFKSQQLRGFKVAAGSSADGSAPLSPMRRYILLFLQRRRGEEEARAWRAAHERASRDEAMRVYPYFSLGGPGAADFDPDLPPRNWGAGLPPGPGFLVGGGGGGDFTDDPQIVHPVHPGGRVLLA
ncbi:hypothetical protein JKP88DRAFT_335497 [Tribonema minus]|uniref:F-box domain-containing protein n=1 Tax=Tribonema minus TaxID=303371 RepID=A0A835YU21_9STRA|nr:hypothetical protein JKP88DRAFT_335497 [Tribonema minus]